MCVAFLSKAEIALIIMTQKYDVLPFIPDEDYDNPAMVVDFYEFTMANCLFLHGFKDAVLVFDMFSRKNPNSDVLALDGEVIEAGKPLTVINLDHDAIEREITIIPARVKKLLVPYILNGVQVITLPSITEKREYIAHQLAKETWESELRPEYPHKHYVDMTPAVAQERESLYRKLHGGNI